MANYGTISSFVGNTVVGDALVYDNHLREARPCPT